jgi:glycerol uptake facilitator protein
MLGAFLVWLFNKDHFAITDNEGGKFALVQSSYPNYSSNLISEIIGTLFYFRDLLYCWTRTYLKQTVLQKIGLGTIGALPVAILVWAIGLSLEEQPVMPLIQQETWGRVSCMQSYQR